MDKAPKCPKCAEVTIQANAGLFQPIYYWYCRNCKEEVVENARVLTGGKAKLTINGKEIEGIEGVDITINPDAGDMDLLKEFERLVAEGGSDEDVADALHYIAGPNTTTPDDLDRYFGFDPDSMGECDD